MIPEASYDLIVVGAGPAGSTAALYAARGGASVLLLDKKGKSETQFSVQVFSRTPRRLRLFYPMLTCLKRL